MYLKSFALLSFIIFSFSSHAYEKTNCRLETKGQQNIYSGYSSCTAIHNYTDWENQRIVRKVDHYNLEEFIAETTRSRTNLSKLITVNVHSMSGEPYSYRTTVSCPADIPFSHKEDVKEEVCDYKPKANIRVERMFPDEESVLIIADGSDKDGTIVSQKLWVDDIPVSSGYVAWGRTGKIITIKLHVTDNDGYTDEITKNYQFTGCGPRCNN